MFESYFHKLFGRFVNDTGVGHIELGHSRERVRCNGGARLTTWIDVYDAFLNHKEDLEHGLRLLQSRLDYITGAIGEVDQAMARRKLSRCPDCEVKKGEPDQHWGMRSKKGTGGPYTNGWRDCQRCGGTGIVEGLGTDQG